MASLAIVLTLIVALLHVYFLVLEMFLWTTPFGQKTFNRTKEQQEETKVLAANQGLYNGFLAAGLFWSIFQTAPADRLTLRTFFLGCVVLAGVYGAWTADRKILYIQALPGFLALGASILTLG